MVTTPRLNRALAALDAATKALDYHGRLRPRTTEHLELIEAERAAERAVIEAARSLAAPEPETDREPPPKCRWCEGSGVSGVRGRVCQPCHGTGEDFHTPPKPTPSPTQAAHWRKLAAERCATIYGDPKVESSAWAHMSADQREDARLAAAARILQAQDGEKYAPAIALLDACMGD